MIYRILSYIVSYGSYRNNVGQHFKFSTDTERRAGLSSIAELLVYYFRLLVACLTAGIVATILFLAAMATTDWVRLHYPSGLYRRSTSAFVSLQVSGLFRLCRFECDNSSNPIVYSQSWISFIRSLWQTELTFIRSC